MSHTFEELIGRCLDDLYSAALCFTLDEERAEALLQEASIRAFHQLAHGRRDADFHEAMLEILVATHLRRLRRAGRDPLAEDAPSFDDLLGREGSAHRTPFPEPGTSAYGMLRAWMTEAWAELDDGDRLILWLADVERLRHRRLAALVGIPQSQVRARHYRARSLLSRRVNRQLNRREAHGRGS